MSKFSEYNIYRFISQLLDSNYNFKNNHQYFSYNENFWENFVKVASSHMVLPSIYCSLKRKNLLCNIPIELKTYLKKIKDINKSRNLEILKQIDSLNNLFVSHNYKCVFLKGSAILLDEPYDAISERMIGDIDILVSKDEIVEVQNLLLENGYKEKHTTDFKLRTNKDFNSEKHLNRLNHKDYIASVEIHLNIVDAENKICLSPKEIIKNSRRIKSGHYVPSELHLWQHVIYNWQYNDKGYYFNKISFRTIFDVLHLHSDKYFTKKIKSDKSIIHYYSTLMVFYNKKFNKKFNKIFKNNVLLHLKIRYKRLKKTINFYYASLFIIRLIFSRIIVFIKDNNYRSKIIANPLIIKEKIVVVWSKL